MINSGGIKLMPEQIEKKLQAAIPGRFFVTGLPDETLGQKLVVVLESETDPEVLMQKLRGLGSLAPYEIPREVFSIPAFANTGSGKIDRKATLRRLENEGNV